MRRCQGCHQYRSATHCNQVAAAQVYITATEKAGRPIPGFIRKLARS